MPALSVIIVAHGSSYHSGGAELAAACCEHVRETTPPSGVVLAAVWKGEGLHLHDAIDACPPGYVLFIPLVMNDGYFGTQVFPRALDLEVRADGWTTRGPQHLRLSPPLGLDPRFDTLVRAQAKAVLDDPSQRLIVVAHGTDRDADSSRRVRALQAQLHADIAGSEARVRVAFLDQQPTLHEVLRESIHEADSETNDDATTLLPWFAADGQHAGVDIPAIVGEWGRPATILPSVGALLFPSLCEARVRDAIESLREAP